MTIVLRNQIEASEKSAQEIEAKLRDHHRLAMFCYEVEDLVQAVLGIFFAANAHVKRWQAHQSQSTDAHADNAEIEKNWNDTYRHIGRAFEATAICIRMAEQDQFTVSGKREFMSGWEKVRAVTCFDLDSVSRSIQEATRGDVRPLAEVERELFHISNG
jgi:hypothetical protein